ncbi:hypothetical protein [Williamsoniiplasma lucivorax]|uniref:Uncharacterized protein n=1 Tax=Williamsoniiplasma lucivorax TaxID=209274 RepID=A0A2S5RAG0_9MOLU|nr:hypothetical protein [Williamsoniiplasma lucivorax]PPE04309.1 hypothetical protein ELUCI_v1c08300 [Williamsoniiplasma lucivorax]
MKKFKIITIVFLMISIMFWALLTSVLVWLTEITGLFSLLIFAFMGIFNLVWWILVADDKKEVSLFIKFCFGCTLNIPAIWSAQKYRQTILKQTKIKKAQRQVIDPELDNEYDFTPDWEKAIIAQKAAKKAAKSGKEKTKKTSAYLESPDFILQRKIINAYCKYLLFLVLSADKELKDTFQTTALVKEKAFITNPEKQIQHFIKDYKQFLNENFEKTDAELKQEIMKTLTDTSAEEIMVAYKENRVDNTIEVKHQLGIL